jgi:bifunctional aspartokinase / homoserine dehydrogenase 1
MGAGLKEYHALLAARRSGEASYQYETTVGGGLPVLLTLQNAQSSGDAPVVVEGVISAFLSRVFNAVSPAAAAFSNSPSSSSSSSSSSSNNSSEGMLFSEACALAAAEGLVDAQNPLQQLCCLDVSRRLLILGRELGLQLDTDSVAVEPVLPARSCSDNGNNSSTSSDGSRDNRSSSSSSGAHSVLPDGSLPPQLLTLLQQQDAHFAQAAAAAHSRGAALRYIARVDVHSCSATAGLVEVPFSDPMAQLTGAAYCVRYVSSESSSSSGCQRAPVVLQGPVGGAATIASALFSDVIRVARDLGARDRGHLMKSVPSFAIKHSVAN